MVFCCFVELGEDDGGGDSVVGGEVEDVAGAVVYPGQYFDVCSVGELVVGEVGLPSFVGHCCFEPNVGGLGTFFGCGDDESRFAEVAADRRWRDGDGVVCCEVPGDGVGACVESGFVEVFAEGDDFFDGVFGCSRGAAVGFSGASLEGFGAFLFVAFDEFGYPAF